MRNTIIVAGSAFAVALAVVVGNRLSSEAMAVVAGAVCGISASIPISIGLVIAASNQWGRNARGRLEQPHEIGYADESRRYLPQPPVVIVSPPQAQMPYGYPHNSYVAPLHAPMLGAPREFKIVGGE
jgi:hypothetical protein